MTRFSFCAIWATPLSLKEDNRQACGAEGCAFVHYNNPTPVVAATVETEDGVVFAQNKSCPERMFGPVTGFLERGEYPAEFARREIREELALTAGPASLIGAYPFLQMNQVVIAFHMRAAGEVRLGDELDVFKIIPVNRLKAWSFGTGLAVRDWLEKRKFAS